MSKREIPVEHKVLDSYKEEDSLFFYKVDERSKKRRFVLRRLRELMDDTNLFTEKQKEILDLIGLGKTDGDIAEMLGIYRSTVRAHIKLIAKKANRYFEKLGLFEDYKETDE